MPHGEDHARGLTSSTHLHFLSLQYSVFPPKSVRTLFDYTERLHIGCLFSYLRFHHITLSMAAVRILVLVAFCCNSVAEFLYPGPMGESFDYVHGVPLWELGLNQTLKWKTDFTVYDIALWQQNIANPGGGDFSGPVIYGEPYDTIDFYCRNYHIWAETDGAQTRITTIPRLEIVRDSSGLLTYVPSTMTRRTSTSSCYNLMRKGRAHCSLATSMFRPASTRALALQQLPRLPPLLHLLRPLHSLQPRRPYPQRLLPPLRKTVPTLQRLLSVLGWASEYLLSYCRLWLSGWCLSGCVASV